MRLVSDMRAIYTSEESGGEHRYEKYVLSLVSPVGVQKEDYARARFLAIIHRVPI